jgi:hypothetical protein
MDNTWKYIVVNSMGFDVPVVFPSLLNHNSIYCNNMVVSAGFVHLNIVKDQVIANCYGHSVSLRKQSRPEDSEILTKFLNNDN